MKETIVKLWKRVKHVFNGTKECHAKLDQAVTRAQEASKRAESICEERRLVTNGHGKA